MDTQKLFTRVEIKAVDTSQREISGYAAYAGNEDRTGDIIDKGAFDRTLRERPDVAVFIGHDSSRLPVGEPIEMRADAQGLFTRTSIYNTPDGDALLEVARRRLSTGRTLGMSIGFRTKQQSWISGKRHLTDIDLVEFSFLASPDFAANPLAQVTGVKARKATGIGPVITTDDSYEDLIDDLEDAAATALGVYSCCVCATFSDHVIVSAMDMSDPGEMAYYDFPYTLNADGEPELGDPQRVDPAFVPADAKERAETFASKAGGYDPNDNSVGASGRGDFAYVDSDGRGHLPVHDEAHVRAALGRFDQTQFESDAKKKQAARKVLARARKFGIEVAPDSAVGRAAGLTSSTPKPMKGLVMPPTNYTRGVAWDAAYVAALPDDAFAFIEGDGTATKDDTDRTVPRSLRHYPHHNPDGSVDAAHLAHALEHAETLSGELREKSILHLAAHARAADHAIDAHAAVWSEGAAAGLLTAGYKLDRILKDIADDRRSMERTGLDTKNGARLTSTTRQQIAEVRDQLSQTLAWADLVEKGDDGKMRVDMFRHRLAMLQLEEVS